MKKNRIIVTSIIAMLLLTGCRSNAVFFNHSPRDDFSREIKKAVGDDFVFWGIDYTGEGVPIYSFEINTYDPLAIGNLTYAFQSNLTDMDKVVGLDVDLPSHSGLRSVMFYLNNDIKDENGEIVDNSYKLQIYRGDPELYSQIEGIKELHVDKGIQDIADEKGIDWYTYWPELETVVVEDNH